MRVFLLFQQRDEQVQRPISLYGPFPWDPCLHRCQGKHLRGSGLDDVLLECWVFGTGAIEILLNGSHYLRALTGMLMVEDLIHKLKWKAFWTHKDEETYPVL
ncbi:hypothetical protein DPMN_033764 [Dreissena polymorpha]|uniref:Uncharacterized protein n=1 Tax=Dreissena polymorpha TaxID=45954 RepID=A0A9D4M6M9_DREPO|nr:hypothetical protein DPMN_033764 [Dreissena polymorpha]